MQIGPVHFREIVLADFEFIASPGERQDVVCLVAHELVSGRKWRIWRDELRELKEPPYPIDKDTLFICYYAPAEMGSHLSLGWQLPEHVLDLFTEFRNLTNGRETICGSGLLGALAYFGLDSIESAEKDSMRDLILGGGPWTEDERRKILDYCESDVLALAKLLPKMLPHMDVPRGVYRGRYMKAAARIEHTGVPIDIESFRIVEGRWADIKGGLIERVNADYGVFDGQTFKAEWWERWLIEHNVPWPRIASGALALDDNTFREMARAYPLVVPIHELRVSLSQMKLSSIAVGGDARNRVMLSPFRSKTGRNQPSNSRFIFGPATWVRAFIQPPPGYGLAYVDWSQQEFGIAAALSRDEAMLAAYRSGDPYLAFAKQAGAVPPDGTKATHGPVREQFKACVLAVQYGMGADSLAARIGQPPIRARELLQMHRQTYARFWRWSEAAVSYAYLHGRLWTRYGWTVHVGPLTNGRSLANFPMQANGAEMLRLACCLATERGISVCAPVHDAILVEAPLDRLEQTVEATQQAMSDASAEVLDGFRLRSDAKLIRHPDRYMDERGEKMWKTVWDAIGQPAP
jgi:DNA polymerase I - 3''-5'' exonuclease and polymerase domains